MGGEGVQDFEVESDLVDISSSLYGDFLGSGLGNDDQAGITGETVPALIAKMKIWVRGIGDGEDVSSIHTGPMLWKGMKFNCQ